MADYCRINSRELLEEFTAGILKCIALLVPGIRVVDHGGRAEPHAAAAQAAAVHVLPHLLQKDFTAGSTTRAGFA